MPPPYGSVAPLAYLIPIGLAANCCTMSGQVSCFDELQNRETMSNMLIYRYEESDVGSEEDDEEASEVDEEEVAAAPGNFIFQSYRIACL